MRGSEKPLFSDEESYRIFSAPGSREGLIAMCCQYPGILVRNRKDERDSYHRHTHYPQRQACGGNCWHIETIRYEGIR